MSRLIAFILGGVALALFGPFLVLSPKSDILIEIAKFWGNILPDDWAPRIFQYGPGVFAGLALILFAIRGKD